MIPASLRRHLGPAALMGGGLATVGLAGFVFLAICGHTLNAADAAAVASFYLIVSIVGTGVFAGLEQETSRSTSAWLATGGRLGVVARRAAAVGVGLLAVVLVVLAAISPVMTAKTLSAHWGLFLAVVLAAIASAAISGLRGLLGGTQQFAGYASSLFAEGLSRIVLCVLVVVVGLTSSLMFALVFVAGIGFAGLAGLPWLRRGVRPSGGTSAPERTQESVVGMARALGLLVGATLGFQTLSNLAPILVTARLGSDTATAAAFAYAFVLVRVPILLFVAVQTMLLPALTKAVTNGNLSAVRHRLRQIALLLAALGVPTVVGSAVLGPWALEVLFGAKVRLSHAVLGFLAVSTVLLMATQVLMPALVALGRHRVVTVAWAAGTAVLIALMVLPVNPVSIAVWAQLAGCGLVVAIMVAGLAGPLRHRVAPDPASVPALTGT